MVAKKKAKKYNVVLVDVAYQGKPDKVIDKEYELGEIVKEGERLAKTHQYTTFRIQEAKPKRTRKPAATKAAPKAEPKTTTRKKAAPKAEPKKKTTTRKKAESKTETEKPKRVRKTTVKKEVAESKPKRKKRGE